MERKLDLNNYGLVEMNDAEMQDVSGGQDILKTMWGVANYAANYVYNRYINPSTFWQKVIGPVIK